MHWQQQHRLSGLNKASIRQLDKHKPCLTACAVAVRLNGGRDPRQGRLELFYDGGWGTVCGPLNSAAAGVVCNMLGYGYVPSDSKKLQ